MILIKTVMNGGFGHSLGKVFGLEMNEVQDFTYIFQTYLPE